MFKLVVTVWGLLGMALAFHVWRQYQARASGRANGAGWPSLYLKRPLSTAEQQMYLKLVAALPGHLVLPRVPLAQVLGAHDGFRHLRWVRRFHRLQFDFVICGPDASVLAVVEAASGEPAGRRAEVLARYKQGAAQAAGLRYLTWPADAMPESGLIREAMYTKTPLSTALRRRDLDTALPMPQAVVKQHVSGASSAGPRARAHPLAGTTATPFASHKS